MKSLLSLFSLLLLFSLVCGYGEPDATGHPTWQERANHVWLNAVRIAPSQYRNSYMAGYSPSPSGILTSHYPAVAPLYLEPKLVSSAFAHSNDMAINNCFSHPSCDGTDTFVRIKSYYSCSGTMGENIAAGGADPIDTTNQWLCDSTGSPAVCAADGSGNDGHRSNMMGSGYKAVGTGFAYTSTSTWKYYWTQDFGGSTCASITSPVYGGSHRVKSGTTRFVTVYYTSPAAAPSSASVVVAGTSYPLSLDLGASGAGSYIFDQASGTGCRSYYFQFGSVRYPETGCLVTYGEGSCTTSFDASCSGSASATAGSATTGAPKPTSTTGSAASTTGTPTSGTPTSGTPVGAAYYLYTSSLQNSWVLQYNGITVTNSFVYNGVAGLKAVLTGTSPSNFIMFNHATAVPSIWTTLKFNVAASNSGSITVFFNGGYYVSQAVTTQWQAVSISFSSLGSPASLGGSSKQLVFSTSAGLSLYLNNVAFV